jgi:hypothetical protein
MIQFDVDQEDIIVTVSFKLSIREFLNRVREVYEYASNYNSVGIGNNKAKLIEQDKE